MCIIIVPTSLTLQSEHLVTVEWMCDSRILFSHIFLIRCAHLRPWGHRYQRSDCNFHNGVCACCGSAMFEAKGTMFQSPVHSQDKNHASF